MEAKPPLRFRKLRIAWSLAWSVVAVLLCVLWVRSYWWYDVMYGRFSNDVNIGIGSCRGKVGYTRVNDGSVNKWGVKTYSMDDWDEHGGRNGKWLRYVHGGTLRLLTIQDVGVPHWFLMLVFISLAAAPWYRSLDWRFSLRTLLIVTTLVAVGLGTIVWLSA
jgi:hypothetical protein